MPKVFISYRRDDTGYIATMIAQRLKSAFGDDSVFLDVDSILLGTDFRSQLDLAMSQSDLVLVLIGPNWLTISDENGRRRLDAPRDFVRLEIEFALRKGLPVIPVLGDHASLPKEKELPTSLGQLAYRNATEMRSGRDLLTQLDRLVVDIEASCAASNRSPSGKSVADSHHAGRANATPKGRLKPGESSSLLGSQVNPEIPSPQPLTIDRGRTWIEKALLTYTSNDPTTQLLHRVFHIGLAMSIVFSLAAFAGQLPNDWSPIIRFCSRLLAAILPYPILFSVAWLPARRRDRGR